MQVKRVIEEGPLKITITVELDNEKLKDHLAFSKNELTQLCRDYIRKDPSLLMSIFQIESEEPKEATEEIIQSKFPKAAKSCAYRERCNDWPMICDAGSCKATELINGNPVTRS